MHKPMTLILLTVFVLCSCTGQGTTRTYLHMSAPTATFASPPTQVPESTSFTTALTSIALSPGDCVDFETIAVANNLDCDLLYMDGEMVPQNGAALSSVEHIVEPPVTQCVQELGEMNAEGRILSADRYYCLRSNAGRYGILRATHGSDTTGAAGIMIKWILEP
jgi:hypothetical protein